jgi:hypothetical protein
MPRQATLPENARKALLSQHSAAEATKKPVAADELGGAAKERGEYQQVSAVEERQSEQWSGQLPRHIAILPLSRKTSGPSRRGRRSAVAPYASGVGHSAVNARSHGPFRSGRTGFLSRTE